MKKIWLKRCLFLALGCGCYLALLQLLIYIESFSENPSITNIWEAIWFSLVTITTVGYGDRFPTTLGGRIIGMLFLLSSTGLLAFLIGMTLSIMTEKILPRLRLFRVRKHPWYIFSGLTGEAAALASNLEREQPDAVLVFCVPSEAPSGGQPRPVPGDRWHIVKYSPQAVLRWKRSLSDASLLIMGENGCANYLAAQEGAAFGIPVYCQTEFTSDNMPDQLVLFDRWDCCARLYWQQHPLSGAEKHILLIGCGRYGAALLERALLVNVYGTDRSVNYHVFGDSSIFRKDHIRLKDIVCTEECTCCSGQDSVLFHGEPWDAASELLAQADRIILCMDTDEENMEILRRIHQYFPVRASLHLRLSRKLESVVSFGSDEAIFTPDLVLRTSLNQLAMEMHEIYRRSDPDRTPLWNQLSAFLRCSNLAAADHLLTKIRILLEDDSITEITPENCRTAYQIYQETREDKAEVYREIEHLRWMRFHVLRNWHYGSCKDSAGRLHPDIRPFCQLSLSEQAKDDYAWELLGKISLIQKTPRA